MKLFRMDPEGFRWARLNSGRRRFFLKKMTAVAALLLISSLGYAGSIPESKLNQLSLGMKPEKIISILGQPDFRRPEAANADGKSVETMEYSVTRRIDMTKVENDNGDRISTSICSLMIVDGVLVRIDRRR